MGSRYKQPLPPVVLVVEDEPILRMHAVAMIEDAGFVACEAWNAGEAITVLESRPDIHIVFTDIDMPGGMDGIKLAAAIRNRWPPIEIILTSEFTAPHLEDVPARGIFLPKPYQSEAVLDAIRRFAA